MTNIDVPTNETASHAGTSGRRLPPVADAKSIKRQGVPRLKYWGLPTGAVSLLWHGIRRGDAAAIERVFDKHGDLFGFTLPPGIDIVGIKKVVFLRDPALIKPLFTAPADVVDSTQANRVAETLYGDRSLFLIDGPDHKRLRKVIIPRLRGTELDRWGAALERTMRQETEQWLSSRSVNVYTRSADVALQSILNITLGVGHDDMPKWYGPMHDMFELPRIVEMTARYPFRNFGSLGRWWPSYNRKLAAGDALIYQEIAHRRAFPDIERVDLLDLLMRIDGEPLSDKELRDQIVTMVFAGHETNATTVTWAINFLLRNPDALAKAVAEARDDAGEGTYIEAVINETLRLHPPAPAVGRVTLKRFDLGQYQIPPNTLVVPWIEGIHRDASLYAEPETFRPERFLDNKPGVYTLIPFGGGPHRCVGDRLAIFQTTRILQTIFRHTDLQRVGTERTTRTILPTNGVHIRAHRPA